MIERFQGLAMLLLVASLFVAGIAGLGSMLFSTPAGAGPVNEAATTTTSPITSPSRMGAHVEVQGDASGSFESGESQLDRDQVTYVNGNNRLVLGQDENGLHVQHFTFARLDFYLDPSDCELTVGDTSTTTGFAVVDFSCDSIGDIRDNGTLSISGKATVPTRLVMTGLPELGGTLSLGGEVSRTLDIPQAVWFTSPPGVAPVGGHSLAMWDRFEYLAFDETAGGKLALSLVSLHGQDHSIDPGVCDASATELAQVSDTESIDRVDIDCTQVSLGEAGTTSIEGSVVVDHLRLDS